MGIERMYQHLPINHPQHILHQQHHIHATTNHAFPPGNMTLNIIVKSHRYYEQSNNQKPLSSKSLMAGPRGGNYYMNKNGNRTYVSASAYKSSSAYSAPATSYSRDNKPCVSSRKYDSQYYRKEPSYYEQSNNQKPLSSKSLMAGPRGGSYYMNKNGNRTYVSPSSYKSSSAYSAPATSYSRDNKPCVSSRKYDSQYYRKEP
eukprot:193380_1